MRKSSLIPFICLLAVSCLDQPDCYNLTNNFVNISYRRMLDGTLDSMRVLDASVVGLDSVFKSSISGVTFPLDFTTGSQTVEIENTSKTLVIELQYDVQAQFVSEECGPRFVLSALQANSEDSVRVLSATPGTSATHVAIYNCPRTNIVRVAFRQLLNEKIIKDTITITQTTADDGAAYAPVNFYRVTGALSFINLPLSVDTNSTTFSFTVAGETKQMTFLYTLTERTLLERCGPQKFISDLTLNTDLGQPTLVETTRYVADSIYDPPKINFAIIK